MSYSTSHVSSLKILTCVVGSEQNMAKNVTSVLIDAISFTGKF